MLSAPGLLTACSCAVYGGQGFLWTSWLRRLTDATHDVDPVTQADVIMKRLQEIYS